MNVVVAAVAESFPPFSKEIVFLFRSLAALGGSMARAQRIAYFVGQAEPAAAAALARLGVTIKVVPRLNPACPHANKIHMLLDEEVRCDVRVALDADVVVARDFSAWLGRAPFAAKPVDQNPMQPEAWSDLLGRLGVPVPAARHLTHFDAVETLPYFNSGVLIVDGSHAKALGNAWLRAVSDVQAIFARSAAIAPHAFFTDQLALVGALGRLELQQLALPLEMNFPTHHPVHETFQPAAADPFLLHHHHRFDKAGRIRKTGYAGPDAALARVNAVLQASPG